MQLYHNLLLYRCLVWCLLIVISVLVLFGCDDSCEDRVDETLTLSGDNRFELETVLSYYSDIHPDQEKLKAAQFLIANMRFIAHFGVFALRGCGIPSAIEYNIAYKEWHDRHYFSVIFIGFET